MAADNTVTTTMGRMGMDRAIDGGYAEYPSVFEPAGQVRVEVDEVVVGVGGTRCDAGDGADGVGGACFGGFVPVLGSILIKGLSWLVSSRWVIHCGMFEKEGRFVWPGCRRRVEIGGEYVNTIRDETQVLCWLEAKIGRVF